MLCFARPTCSDLPGGFALPLKEVWWTGHTTERRKQHAPTQRQRATPMHLAGLGLGQKGCDTLWVKGKLSLQCLWSHFAEFQKSSRIRAKPPCYEIQPYKNAHKHNAHNTHTHTHMLYGVYTKYTPAREHTKAWRRTGGTS